MAQKYVNTKSTSTSTSTESKRGKTNGYSSAHIQAKRRQRQYQADDRQAKYDALSLDEKIKSCVPGGSKRQLAKLLNLKASVPVPVAKVQVTDKPKKATKKTVKS